MQIYLFIVILHCFLVVFSLNEQAPLEFLKFLTILSDERNATCLPVGLEQLEYGKNNNASK